MTEPSVWIKLGPLDESACDFSVYAKDIGLYRGLKNGDIVYIGKATELNNGGFRKRLRDYSRSSDSARNYPAGRLMHEHRASIDIVFLIYERSDLSIPRIADDEHKLIELHQPKWNFLT